MISRLRRKRLAWGVNGGEPKVPTLWQQRSLTDSPSPFDEAGIDPNSLKEQGDYYHDELDDLYMDRMNPTNIEVKQ